jgi:hypothetical protein
VEAGETVRSLLHRFGLAAVFLYGGEEPLDYAHVLVKAEEEDLGGGRDAAPAAVAGGAADDKSKGAPGKGKKRAAAPSESDKPAKRRS